MAQTCPVCSRKIMCDSPQKGDVAWEETYCSKYCRLYSEQGLEKVPFEGGFARHSGQKRWPRIAIPCEMCDKEIMLVFDIEKRNRAFCSRKCWNNLKSCQKRGIQKTLNMLSFLYHRKMYYSDAWLSPSVIAERSGRKGIMCSPTTVGLSMKRWRKAGIIESRLKGGSQHGHEYRFIPKGLKGMTVSQFIYKWNNMSYAEKISFKTKEL